MVRWAGSWWRKGVDLFLFGGVERQSGEFADEADGFKADGDDLADEADDVFGIVRAVGIVEDARALVGGDAVLIDDPLDGAAVA